MSESPGKLVPQGHFGLLGLYERADLIGAQLTIDSKVGEGTRLIIFQPIQRTKNDSIFEIACAYPAQAISLIRL